jgi:hypothetical protein
MVVFLAAGFTGFILVQLRVQRIKDSAAEKREN